MDDKDKKDNALGKLLAAAGAAAVGLWGLYRLTKKPLTPEEAALRELKDFNPHDRKDVNKLLSLNAAVQASRKIKDLRDAGYPLNPAVERAMVDEMRYRGDVSPAGTAAYQEAMGRLVREAGKLPEGVAGKGEMAEQQSGKATQQRRLKCAYCNGAGWYICSGCNGTGRNRLMPPKQYTGDRRFDALVDFNSNDTCKSCGGKPEIHCRHCGGTGYQQ